MLAWKQNSRLRLKFNTRGRAKFTTPSGNSFVMIGLHTGRAPNMDEENIEASQTLNLEIDEVRSEKNMHINAKMNI